MFAPLQRGEERTGGSAAAAVECAFTGIAAAHELLRSQDHEMAVVRAVYAAEVFVGTLLRTRPLNGQWRRRLERDVRRQWGIELDRLETWTAMRQVFDLRDAVLERGRPCDLEQAQAAIETCRAFIEAVALARVSARPAYVSRDAVATR